MDNIPFIFDGLMVRFDPKAASSILSLRLLLGLCKHSGRSLGVCTCNDCTQLFTEAHRVSIASPWIYATLRKMPGHAFLHFTHPSNPDATYTERESGASGPLLTTAQHKLWLMLYHDYLSNAAFDTISTAQRILLGNRGLHRLGTPGGAPMSFYGVSITPDTNYVKKVQEIVNVCDTIGLHFVDPGQSNGPRYLVSIHPPQLGQYRLFKNSNTNKWNLFSVTRVHTSQAIHSNTELVEVDYFGIATAPSKVLGLGYSSVNKFTYPIGKEYLELRNKSLSAPAGQQVANCQHLNKREVECGIGGGGDKFWYCPDCKQEV